MKLREVICTCGFCPSQWECVSENGRPVYVRYRWGCLGIGVGKPGESIDAAIEKEFSNPDIDVEIGGPFDGTMEWDDVIPYINSLSDEAPHD